MSNHTLGRAAIYARISDDREDEERGVNRQIEDGLAKAAALGFEVIEPPFVDNDISASTRSTKKRPAYDDMLERARRGEFGTIIAYSNSRLTRRPMEFEDLIRLFEQSGTVIRTVVSGDDDLSTADGRMVARIKASVDAAEAERTAERVKRAVDQRKKLGEHHGSVAPYGYQIVPKKDRATAGVDLVPNDHEVQMIREAVTRLLDANDSVYSITKDWNFAKRLSRTGKAWRQSSLSAALVNPALIAHTRPVVSNGARRAPIGAKGNPARWEPILDEATFDALVERLRDPSRSAPNPTGKKSSKYALGSGLTVCGRCGSALYIMKRSGEPMRLQCRASASGEHENHPIDPQTGFSTGRVTATYDLVEEYVFDQFVKRLNNIDYWNAHKHDADPHATEKIAEAERRREAEHAKVRRAEDQAFEGLIPTDRLRELIEQSRQRIRDLDAEIADLKGKPSQRDKVVSAFGAPEWILEQWPSFPPDAKRTLLKFLIDKVVINDYPEGLAKTASVKRDETLEQFEARRLALWRRGIRERVVIEWRE